MAALLDYMRMIGPGSMANSTQADTMTVSTLFLFSSRVHLFKNNNNNTLKKKSLQINAVVRMLLFGSQDISTGKSSVKPQKMLWGYPHSRQCDGQEISRWGGGGGCSCTPQCRLLHALEIELHESFMWTRQKKSYP